MGVGAGVAVDAQVVDDVGRQQEVEAVDVGVERRVQMVTKCLVHDPCKVVGTQVDLWPKEPTHCVLDGPVTKMKGNIWIFSTNLLPSKWIFNVIIK